MYIYIKKQTAMQETLKELKAERKRLINVVNTAHHIRGRNALESCKFVNRKIQMIELTTKINKLEAKQFLIRNNREWDRTQNQIDKLREKFDSIKYMKF